MTEVDHLVEASTHYPCAKRAWVEFLGETPDPLIDPSIPRSRTVTAHWYIAPPSVQVMHWIELMAVPAGSGRS